MSAAEDRTAVESVLAGNTEAFAALVSRWQGPLINLAYRFCGDRGRAEEMAQEAFLRAYRSLASWRKDAAFSTWLFAVATNVYRTELKRIPAAISLDAIAEPRDPRAMDGGLAERDRDQAVRQAVSVLPPKYREVIVLFYFHEMDLAATSKSLGLPEGTVKARLFRGRELLRGKLPQVLASSRFEVMV